MMTAFNESTTSSAMPTRIQFDGGGLALLGYGLLLVLSMIPVVTYGWGIEKYYRWFLSNISFDDGTVAQFEGKASDILLASSAAALLTYAGIGMGFAEASFTTQVAVSLLLMPFQVVTLLAIWRWAVAGISTNSGNSFTFTGSYGGLLGWNVLNTLASYTFFLAPFATVGMTRWSCKHITGGRRELVFEGTGLRLLGQMIITVLLCLLIITMPYAIARLVRWFVANCRLEPRGATDASLAVGST